MPVAMMSVKEVPAVFSGALLVVVKQAWRTLNQQKHLAVSYWSDTSNFTSDEMLPGPY